MVCNWSCGISTLFSWWKPIKLDDAGLAWRLWSGMIRVFCLGRFTFLPVFSPSPLALFEPYSGIQQNRAAAHSRAKRGQLRTAGWDLGVMHQPSIGWVCNSRKWKLYPTTARTYKVQGVLKTCFKPIIKNPVTHSITIRWRFKTMHTTCTNNRFFFQHLSRKFRN